MNGVVKVGNLVTGVKKSFVLSDLVFVDNGAQKYFEDDRSYSNNFFHS